MKNILIIGNKGKLLNTIYSQLISENKFEVSILYFDIVESRFLNNVDIFNSEYDIREINVIIYCGGEVRDRSHMLNRNYIIPKIIVDYCIEEKITFYYLSSLSVYEYFFQNIEISELSIRNAKINYYGITKKLLDDYVELNSNILNYAILKPASIIGSKRLSSSLDKIIKIFIKYKFLKYFRFNSFISFIKMEEIANQLYILLLNDIPRCKLILAHNISIGQIQNLIYKNNNYININPNLFNKILFNISYILPVILKINLQSITNKVIYTSKYKPALENTLEIIYKQINIINKNLEK